jgi:hypothetical protein
VRALLALGAVQGLRLSRRPWLRVALAAGVVLAGVAGAVAAADEGLAREDALRRGVASLLLLGGLAVAIGLGSTALNRDADSGHLGLLLASGAGRARLAAAAAGARLLGLAVILAAWAIGAQAASLALGLGLDGPLAVHGLAVAEGLALTLLAAAAASSVVGPVPAGLFGAAVYVVAQAAVNLKAAADQGLIGTADAGVTTLYYLVPRAIVSPMIAGLQIRDEAGPAAPRLEINESVVLVPAAGWVTVLWTLAWCALLGILCASGLRRRALA